MAYNGFPATYPYYQQYSYQQPNNGMIWIQGIESAKAYQISPNSTVVLWDSDENVVYIKSADAAGMPSIKILDYTIRENPVKKTVRDEGQNYVTKSEITKEIERLEKMIHEVSKVNSVSEQAE